MPHVKTAVTFRLPPREPTFLIILFNSLSARGDTPRCHRDRNELFIVAVDVESCVHDCEITNVLERDNSEITAAFVFFYTMTFEQFVKRPVSILGDALCVGICVKPLNK